MTRRVTEYDLREINADGDAVNVEQYPTRRKAEKAAAAFALPSGEVVALVIERHVTMENAATERVESSDYETLMVAGDVAALKAGEWVSK